MSFIVSLAILAADEMLLILRLQHFAIVLVLLALGEPITTGDPRDPHDPNYGAENFMRVVIHEPFAAHEYLYHYEYCFLAVPESSDVCWSADLNFPTHKKVMDYDIT